MDHKSNQIVVAFKASPEIVARIDELAKAEGATRAGIVRRWVYLSAPKYLAQQGENAA